MCPLLSRYLKVSGAESPCDYQYELNQQEYQPSHFYSDAQMRMRGIAVVRQSASPLRNVVVMQRTRTDDWDSPSRVPLRAKQSPNRYLEIYQQKCREIEQRAKEKERQIQDGMRDIQIERALFLDPKLKGQAARAAAMSKQLTDNEQADDQNVMNMKRVLDLRAQVKAKVKEVEIYEKIAQQHNRGVEKAGLQAL